STLSQHANSISPFQKTAGQFHYLMVFGSSNGTKYYQRLLELANGDLSRARDKITREQFTGVNNQLGFKQHLLETIRTIRHNPTLLDRLVGLNKLGLLSSRLIRQVVADAVADWASATAGQVPPERDYEKAIDALWPRDKAEVNLTDPVSAAKETVQLSEVLVDMLKIMPIYNRSRSSEDLKRQALTGVDLQDVEIRTRGMKEDGKAPEEATVIEDVKYNPKGGVIESAALVNSLHDMVQWFKDYGLLIGRDFANADAAFAKRNLKEFLETVITKGLNYYKVMGRTIPMGLAALLFGVKDALIALFEGNLKEASNIIDNTISKLGSTGGQFAGYEAITEVFLLGLADPLEKGHYGAFLGELLCTYIFFNMGLGVSKMAAKNAWQLVTRGRNGQWVKPHNFGGLGMKILGYSGPKEVYLLARLMIRRLRTGQWGPGVQNFFKARALHFDFDNTAEASAVHVYDDGPSNARLRNGLLRRGAHQGSYYGGLAWSGQGRAAVGMQRGVDAVAAAPGELIGQGTGRLRMRRASGTPTLRAEEALLEKVATARAIPDGYTTFSVIRVKPQVLREIDVLSQQLEAIRQGQQPAPPPRELARIQLRLAHLNEYVQQHRQPVTMRNADFRRMVETGQAERSLVSRGIIDKGTLPELDALAGRMQGLATANQPALDARETAIRQGNPPVEARLVDAVQDFGHGEGLTRNFKFTINDKTVTLRGDELVKLLDAAEKGRELEATEIRTQNRVARAIVRAGDWIFTGDSLEFLHREGITPTEARSIVAEVSGQFTAEYGKSAAGRIMSRLVRSASWLKVVAGSAPAAAAPAAPATPTPVPSAPTTKPAATPASGHSELIARIRTIVDPTAAARALIEEGVTKPSELRQLLKAAGIESSAARNIEQSFERIMDEGGGRIPDRGAVVVNEEAVGRAVKGGVRGMIKGAPQMLLLSSAIALARAALSKDRKVLSRETAKEIAIGTGIGTVFSGIEGGLKAVGVGRLKSMGIAGALIGVGLEGYSQWDRLKSGNGWKILRAYGNIYLSEINSAASTVVFGAVAGESGGLMMVPAFAASSGTYYVLDSVETAALEKAGVTQFFDDKELADDFQKLGYSLAIADRGSDSDKAYMRKYATVANSVTEVGSMLKDPKTKQIFDRLGIGAFEVDSTADLNRSTLTGLATLAEQFRSKGGEYAKGKLTVKMSMVNIHSFEEGKTATWQVTVTNGTRTLKARLPMFLEGDPLKVQQRMFLQDNRQTVGLLDLMNLNVGIKFSDLGKYDTLRQSLEMVLADYGSGTLTDKLQKFAAEHTSAWTDVFGQPQARTGEKNGSLSPSLAYALLSSVPSMSQELIMEKLGQIKKVSGQATAGSAPAVISEELKDLAERFDYIHAHHGPVAIEPDPTRFDPQVYTVQVALQALGLLAKDKVTGFFGPETSNVLRTLNFNSKQINKNTIEVLIARLEPAAPKPLAPQPAARTTIDALIAARLREPILAAPPAKPQQ
ncbi:MAG TPA: hypothetical protein VMT55_06550, partial [Candidatus Sulfotelmatobacter sp.]|nr:hypothetical protein [Candidatus Sulfotelmatobacter sp.]